jgi:predicted PurR-regulated permease PerM
MINKTTVLNFTTTVLNFLKKNWKFILGAIFALFLIYWLMFFLTPKVEMSVESKQKIDSLTTYVKEIEEEQAALDDKIDVFGQEVNNIENNIIKIKSQKETIREIYHEKINSVNTYTDVELDSFFANRYGYGNYYAR